MVDMWLTQTDRDILRLPNLFYSTFYDYTKYLCALLNVFVLYIHLSPFFVSFFFFPFCSTFYYGCVYFLKAQKNNSESCSSWMETFEELITINYKTKTETKKGKFVQILNIQFKLRLCFSNLCSFNNVNWIIYLNATSPQHTSNAKRLSSMVWFEKKWKINK